MRNFQPVSVWRKLHGSCRALLLENPYGKTILLKRDDPLPVGRWVLKGIIE
jgi:hypothetical protein